MKTKLTNTNKQTKQYSPPGDRKIKLELVGQMGYIDQNSDLLTYQWSKRQLAWRRPRYT